MLIFVLWQDKRPDVRRTIERVAPSLESVFEPILGEGPTIGTHSAPGACASVSRIPSAASRSMRGVAIASPAP